MRTDAELFDEIEERLIQNHPLTEILQLVLLLGGRLGSSELQAWAKFQLEGYGPDDAIPDVRTVSAPIFIDATVGYNLIRHHHVSAMQLPKMHGVQLEDTIVLRDSIDAIERSADHLKTSGDSFMRMLVPNWEVFATEIDKNQFGQNTNLMYREVHANEYKRIVEAARTQTVELLSEFRRSSSASKKLLTGKRADSIVQNVTISGGNNSLQVSTKGHNQQTNAPEKPRGWWEAWGRVSTIITVGTGAVALGAWLLSIMI